MPSVLGLSGLHPEVRDRVAWLLDQARKEGLHVQVTSTLRTRAKQDQLYRAWLARGRTGLPAAPPGYSTHEYGFAVDLVSDNQARLVQLAGCAHLHWAGPGDVVHFDPFGPDAWHALVQGLRPSVLPYRC
jgi:LAS superfamily LD-carboxypeptidase LdcB